MEALARRWVPRSVGIGLHYLALLGLITLVLWFVVPQAIHQIESALGNAPTSTSELRSAAHHSSGLRRRLLLGLARDLRDLPPATSLVHPALELTKKALEVLAGVFLVFAVAAYWVFERDRACSRSPSGRSGCRTGCCSASSPGSSRSSP